MNLAIRALITVLVLALASPAALAQSDGETTEPPAASAQTAPSANAADTDDPTVEEETTEALGDALNAEEAAALDAATEAASADTDAPAEDTAAEQQAADAAQDDGAVVEDLDALRWGGAWRSFWRDGQALMTLEQEGNRVTGTYQPGNGTIEGEIDGVMLRGVWREATADGRLEFAMAPDGASFVGRFGNGEYWNGLRLTDGTLSAALFGRQSAEAAFASFISALNAARNGDALAEIMMRRYLEFAGSQDATNRATNRRLTLLGDLVDMATFRINQVTPSETDDGKATIALGIAGTTYTFPLTIIEKAPEEWAVEVPTLQDLQAIESDVLAATDTQSLEDLAANRLYNPRQALRDFVIGAANWDNGGKAMVLATMDLSDIPETLRATDGPIAAEYIRQIIARLGQPAWQEIPNDPNRKRPLKVYENAGGELLVEKVAMPDETERWLFSAASLESAPAIFQVMQNLPLADGVRPSEPLTDAFRLRTQIGEVSPTLLNRGFLLENWQWLVLLASVVVGLIASLLAALVLRLVMAGMMSVGGTAKETRADILKTMRWPMWTFLLGLFLSYVIRTIGLRQDVSEIANIFAGTLLIVGGTFVAYFLVRAVAEFLARRARETEGTADDIAAILGGGLAKIAVFVGGVIMLSEFYELPYEGVIAALGVGGLAFGFAARDAVANFISAGILMADRPFKKGDFVDIGGVMGTVEDVGMRSTRLRTIDDAVVVLPNAQISEGQVNNMGQRRRRRVTMTLGMTYGTTREKLEEFIGRLHKMMDDDPDVLPDQRINLDQFGAYSIDISIIAYLKSPDLDTYLFNKHQLIGNIIDIASEIGVDFAFPTQTIHVAAPDADALKMAAE
ncbi:MAG: mechanosensitive ion channel family protein [Pseudomonadota bacterium]